MTFLNGKWFVRWSAALIEYSPVLGSNPGLQLYSTWHCPHWSFASTFSSRAILRKPPRNSFTSIFVALGSLCQSVSFSGRVSAWIRPSRPAPDRAGRPDPGPGGVGIVAHEAVQRVVAP